jgi:hypothetical protein
MKCGSQLHPDGSVVKSGKCSHPATRAYRKPASFVSEETYRKLVQVSAKNPSEDHALRRAWETLVGKVDFCCELCEFVTIETHMSNNVMYMESLRVMGQRERIPDDEFIVLLIMTA